MQNRKITGLQAEIELKKHLYKEWVNGDRDIEDSNYERAKRTLPKVMAKLTETQRLYFTEYVVEGLTMSDIGERHGRHRTTVSRVLKAARKRLYEYMVIVSPEYAYEFDQLPARIAKKNNQKKREGGGNREAITIIFIPLYMKGEFYYEIRSL